MTELTTPTNQSALTPSLVAGPTLEGAVVGGNIARSDQDRVGQGDEQENQFSFSLSQAVLSLEINTARALDIHGGLPANSAQPLSGDENQSSPASRRSDFSASPEAAQNQITQNKVATVNSTQATASQSSAQQGEATQASTLKSASPLNSALQASQIPTPQALVPTQAGPAPAAQSMATQSSPNQNGLTSSPASHLQATNIAGSKNNINSQASAPQSTPSLNAAQESFARLIANRLATGDTRFEVRLDPAELGRVDIRLTSGDRPALAMSFEHQSSLDMFRKDEQALRTLLQDSGLQLQDNLQISFEQIEVDNLDKDTATQGANDYADHNANSQSLSSFEGDSATLSSLQVPLPEGLLYTDHPLNGAHPYTNPHGLDRLLDIQI